MNIAEGSGKRTPADQRRFYSMAFGSLRECQAILELEQINDKKITELTDRLGAMLFKLTKVPQKDQPKRDGNGTASTNDERQTPNVRDDS